MTTIQPFSILDLLEYNNVNLDILTETFGIAFYGKYIAKWPEYCISLLNNSKCILGYRNLGKLLVLGKVEGNKQLNKIEKNPDWHGHVTAITVAPVARKQGIARYLMDYLELVTDEKHKGWYVDLFVRAGNTIAITMYKNLGYDLYQTVYKYYSAGEKVPAEDAYDMRKSMSIDPEKICQKPTGKVIKPSELPFH